MRRSSQPFVSVAVRFAAWIRASRRMFAWTSAGISTSGSFTATATLQRKRPGEAASAARDVETYTAGAEKIGEMQGHWDVRLHVKTSEFTSGTVVLELGT